MGMSIELLIGLAIGYLVVGGYVSRIVSQAIGQVGSAVGGAADAGTEAPVTSTEEPEAAIEEEDYYGGDGYEDTEGYY